jgi:surface antigen
MCPEEVHLGWSPAPQWAAISCVALSTSAPTAASDQLRFVSDSSKGKSTASDHHLAYKRHCNLVCVLKRSILGWSPAPRWAAISCVALSTSAPTAASDQLCFVWDSSKAKSNTSDHHLAYKRHCNLVCVLRRSILGWSPAPRWAANDNATSYVS